MAVNELLMPRANAALVNRDGTGTIEFRNFLLQFVRDAGAAGAVTEQQLAALTARVQALEDAALEDMLQGFASVAVNGNIIYLVGDVANPQGSQYYGTNRDGVRGWYNIIDGFEAGTGLIKTVSTDGFNFLGYITSTSQLPPTGALNDAYILNGQYIYWNGTEWANGGSPSNIATLALAPAGDTGAGTLQAITVDTYGRVIGKKAATITGTASQIVVANGDASAGLPTISLADLANSGSGTLRAYTRDAKGRISGDKAATITGTTNQITVANGDASAGLPTLSLAAPVLASLAKADSAVQSVVAGTGISVNNTNPQNPIVSSTVTIPAHNALSGLQGGTSGQYYHLTSAELARIPPSGGTLAQFLRGDNTFGNYLSSSVAFGGTTPNYTGFSVAATIEGALHGAFEVASNRADANAALIGAMSANYRTNSTGHQRIADIQFVTEGSTPNQRGGAFYFYCKRDGSTSFMPVFQIHQTGSVTPGVDNTQSLGESALRWSVVYAGTGSINTSDEREKTPVRDLTEAELEASIALGKEIGAYKWLSSVSIKGDQARWHIGCTVQRAIEVMESFGLDAFSYGFICHDRWDESPEVWEEYPEQFDEDGNVINEKSRTLLKPARQAGDLYSFRPDGLHAFILRGMVESHSRLIDRVSALENIKAPI